MKKDRNSVEAIRSDISFLDDLQTSLRNRDYNDVAVCLSDWKCELRDLLREEQEDKEEY